MEYTNEDIKREFAHLRPEIFTPEYLEKCWKELEENGVPPQKTRVLEFDSEGRARRYLLNKRELLIKIEEGIIPKTPNGERMKRATRSGAGMGTGTGTETGIRTGARNRTEVGTRREMGTSTEVGTRTEAETRTETGTQTVWGVETQTENTSDEEMETGTEKVEGTREEKETQTGTETDLERALVTKKRKGTRTVMRTETGMNTEPVTASRKVKKTGTIPRTELGVRMKTATVLKTETGSEEENESETVSGTETQQDDIWSEGLNLYRRKTHLNMIPRPFITKVRTVADYRQTPKTNPQAPKTNPQTPKTNPQAQKTSLQTPKTNQQAPKTNPQTPKTNPQTPKKNPQASKMKLQAPNADPESSFKKQVCDSNGSKRTKQPMNIVEKGTSSSGKKEKKTVEQKKAMPESEQNYTKTSRWLQDDDLNLPDKKNETTDPNLTKSMQPKPATTSADYNLERNLFLNLAELRKKRNDLAMLKLLQMASQINSNNLTEGDRATSSASQAPATKRSLTPMPTSIRAQPTSTVVRTPAALRVPAIPMPAPMEIPVLPAPAIPLPGPIQTPPKSRTDQAPKSTRVSPPKLKRSQTPKPIRSPPPPVIKRSQTPLPTSLVVNVFQTKPEISKFVREKALELVEWRESVSKLKALCKNKPARNETKVNASTQICEVKPEERQLQLYESSNPKI